MFNWAWGTTVGDCLRWTAEADEALGKIPERTDCVEPRTLDLRSSDERLSRHTRTTDAAWQT